jgi:hypothetical protein
MRIIIDYESVGLLPKEIEESINLMEIYIHNDKYEADKINCHISRMRGDIIKWISKNRKKEE